jgi:hypothetical protein
MNGGYQVDIGSLQGAAQGLRQSVADLQGTRKTIGDSQCDVPDLSLTQWDLQRSPSATSAYAQVRGDVETFLSQMITRLNDLAEGLDMVARHYQLAEAANTAAADSARP